MRFTARQHNNKKCFDTTDARCKHEHNTMLSSVSPCQLNYYVHSYTSPSISPFSSQDSSIPKRDILQTLPEPGRGAFKCKNSYQLLDTHHIIITFARLALKVIMHNDGDSVNVILPHFAYGVHMYTICDTLKLKEISNTKTAGFCRSAPRTSVV